MTVNRQSPQSSSLAIFKRSLKTNFFLGASLVTLFLLLFYFIVIFWERACVTFVQVPLKLHFHLQHLNTVSYIPHRWTVARPCESACADAECTASGTSYRTRCMRSPCHEHAAACAHSGSPRPQTSDRTLCTRTCDAPAHGSTTCNKPDITNIVTTPKQKPVACKTKYK